MIGKRFADVSLSRREPRAGNPIDAHDHLPVLAGAPITEASAGRACTKRLRREQGVKCLLGRALNMAYKVDQFAESGG